MSDQILARNKLLEGKYSCVLVRDGNIIMTSYDKGIKPVFLKLVESKIPYKMLQWQIKLLEKLWHFYPCLQE